MLALQIRQQAGSHSSRYEAAVGACLQANVPTPEAGISQTGLAPANVITAESGPMDRHIQY
jgi:hypothetical protein